MAVQHQCAHAAERVAVVRWSDGGAATHSVAPTTNVTYTATYAR